MIAAVGGFAAIPAVGSTGRGHDDDARADGRAIRHRHERHRGRMPLPTWTSSFSADGVDYPFTMVGTSPTAGGATRVPTVVVPLVFRFDDDAQPLATGVSPGCVLGADGSPVPGSCVALETTLDGGDVLRGALESPVFRRTGWPLSADARVQYGDAMQRAQFNRFGDWHVELSPVIAVRPQVIDVPSALGVAHVNRRGVVVGRADVDWASAQLDAILERLRLPASVLPVLLSKDVYLYQGDVNACCFLGYHDASAATSGQPARTWVYAAYSTPLAFSNPDIADVHSLSHEIFEWISDPYLDNVTPEWFVDGYGCDNLLETGDALVGVAFTADRAGRTYHLQDAVFLPWFARQSPSTAYGGRYTYLGSFDGPAEGCT